MTTSGQKTLKHEPDAENEIHDIAGHHDFGHAVISPIAAFPAEVALGVVQVLADVVTRAHRDATATTQDADGIVRAQKFEEGAVYMVASPFTGFDADRYLMDFYDVRERDLCSRMHIHTGMRFVRMMTGPQTEIRVSTLSPIDVSRTAPMAHLKLRAFEDEMEADPGTTDGSVRIDNSVEAFEADSHARVESRATSKAKRRRYNVVVPECSWVDMQIPRGTAHQFNAIGPHAVIDTVHPEESIEIFRERASRINMMAQTIFLEREQLPASACASPPN